MTPMRLLFLCFSLIDLPTVCAQDAAPSQQQPYTLRSQANVVLVPTTVQTKKGEVIYGLNASQFVVEDNGVAQQVHLDEDTDVLGLSMIVLVQCSRSAMMQAMNISGLGTMVEGMVGDAPRQIAVASYGKEPVLLSEFSEKIDNAAAALGNLHACEDSQAATLDAVAWASALLSARSDRSRHVILLISETRDHGSHKQPAAVIASLGKSNTVVDAVSFSPGKTELLSGLRFGGGSGPFGLMMMAVNSVKKNAPKTLAALSGGEYISFTSRNGFDGGMQQLTNRIHNYYLLSFTPQVAAGGVPAEGLHELRVSLPEYPDAKVGTRQSYFSGTEDADTAQ